MSTIKQTFISFTKIRSSLSLDIKKTPTGPTGHLHHLLTPSSSAASRGVQFKDKEQ